VSATSTKVLAAVALVITFVAGALVGVVADRAVIMRGRMPQPSAEFIARRLDRRLHFSHQQRVQVTEIIARRQQRITAIWSNIRPAVHEEIEQANIEIDRVLTPEQRIEFTKIRMRLMPRRDGSGIRFKSE
jgi:hypothetical protein